MATTQAQYMRQITEERLVKIAAGELNDMDTVYLITALRWAFSRRQAVKMLADHPESHKGVLAGLSNEQVGSIRGDIITYVAEARGVK